MAVVKNTCSGSGLSVRFWGVRGSHAVCGSRFARFGGNTPCVEVNVNGKRFIVDAGTGVIELGQHYGCQDAGGHTPGDVHILLSHLHHDHISGLPFFRQALCPDSTIPTWCGNLDGESAAAALGEMYQPPLFPVTL